MCLSVAGLGVAWRWEGWGGAINVGFFLANLGLYRVLRGKFLPLRAVAIFSLVLIPGMLFLVCWWRTRSSETIDQGAQHGWKANGSDGGNQGLVSLASLVRGLGQWLLLRQNVKRAGWWILATAIGWVIAAGAGVGAITGTALVLLLRYAPRDP
jgi:hypothetical protein